MPNFRQRKWLLGAIAIAIIILLTLVAAPGGEKNNNGSTYGHAPSGYGAWYEYMSQKQTPIKRWRQPFSQLIKDNSQDVTFIRIATGINYQLSSPRISKVERQWLNQGNTLIILGINQPATAAPFKSFLAYRDRALSASQIEIETTRRYRVNKSDNSLQSRLLSDRFGTVVWSEKVGKGKVIYCTTPYLAANAYQNSPDNYEFLAGLTESADKIYIDEYIHGYKNKETIAQEEQEKGEKSGVLAYLAQTPWYLLFIQLLLIVCVAALAGFRRFGQPNQAKVTIADNSTAYIDALAGVLEKANTSDFVVDTIGKDEQRKLQTSLGLGKSLVDDDILIAACQQQKAESTAELKELLAVKNTNRKISDARLISWVEKWQKINRNS